MPLPHALRPSWRRRLIGATAMLLAAPLSAILPSVQLVGAAATPPALKIVSTFKWVEAGRVPAVHVVGEVANMDPRQAAQDIMVDCRLTKAGATVAEETAAADAQLLQPGEKSPFDVLFVTPPAPSSYDGQSCSLPPPAPTMAQPDHGAANYQSPNNTDTSVGKPGFKVEMDSVTGDSTAGGQLITGLVTNLDTVSVANARLFFTFYADNTGHQTTAEDWLWVNAGNAIPPTIPTPFTLTRFGPAWNGVAAALLVEAPMPAVSLSPASVSLTQVKTRTLAAAPVTLTNTGTADLHLGALTLGGAHPGDWSEVDTCTGATIVSLGSCTIDLSFTPADIGDRSATLTIADDANQNPHTLALTGTGTNPQAIPSPSPLDFHSRAIGTRTSQTLTVSNPGPGDLQVSRLALGGTNASDFTAANDTCSGATVHAGTACTVAFNFVPGALGARSASLSIEDNALDSPQAVSLIGNGVVSAVSFDAPSYSFGNQMVGTTSGALNVTITNRGSSVLNVSNVCVGNPAEFDVGQGGCAPGFSLDPGASRAVPLSFAPAKTGARLTQLTFIDDAVDSPQQVAISGNGTAGGQFHSIPPARIYDTRNGPGAIGPGLQGAPARRVQVTGTGAVPSGAVAAVMNVTVTDTTAASYLTVYPAGGVAPTASNLNWVRGQTVPNLVEVGLSSSGQLDLFNALGTVDVIIDVAGYITAPLASPGADGFFNPVAPARVLDTRSGIAASGRVGNGKQIDVPLLGSAGVPPAGVSAVVLNVTVTNPSDASYLTVFPTGGTPPTASNLNFVRGQTVPNRVIVGLGLGGKVSFFNAAGQVDVIADVGGWYSDGSAGGTGAGFNALAPTRILDTRDGTGGFQGPVGQAPISLLVAGAAGVPAMSSATPPAAVVLNVTATNANAASYLSLWPDQSAQPTASDLNFAARQTVPNLVVVKVGPDGSVDIFNAAGATDVIVDIVGWYS